MSESGASRHKQRLSKSASSEPASISSKSSNQPTNPISNPRPQPLDPLDPTSSAAATTTSTATTTPTPRTPFTPSTTVSIPSQRSQFRLPASPRTTAMTPADDISKAAKVAIPRLKRSLESGDVATKPGGRHRVTHACEPCRHRKTKCSGERPTCRHCQDFKIQCYYADGKRDRVKKQFGSMAEKVSDYERILRDLQTRVSEDDANLIRNSLDRAAMLDTEDVQAESAPVQPMENDAASEASGAESEVSGRAGSTGALDKTDEDFTREGAKATGFMGKNSDVTWMQRLRHENKHGDSSAIQSDEPELGAAVQESSYHLNDLAISPFEAVDPFEMPTQEHARSLFTTYMNRVHPSFPIVGRINLQNQFNKFLARPMNRPPQKWLAIINMIFAIAAKLSHLIQADWQADDRDHLIYFTRARLLSIDAETLFVHADLQNIQIFGLMSFYLMASEQTNRAWSLVGISIRHATSLGLNMRNESPDLSDGLKEIRYRVWWALYTLEHRLCTLTGRVGCILDDHCTTPLPVPVLEEDFETDAGRRLLSSEHQRSMRAPSLNSQTPPSTDPLLSSRSISKDEKNTSRSPSVQNSQHGELDWAKDVTPNSALFFLHYVQLCRITQAALQHLYNPSAVMGKWSDIQTSMQALNQRVENWYRALPPAFDFGRKQRDRDLYEARLALGFYYYSTKQIINRPCLCRLDQKIPGQSDKSHDFNHASALACVNAAREQLELIPDEPNGVGLLRVGPWMTMVHLLVQSATVLMLELSFRAHHMPDQVEQILAGAKKAVRWLHALADDNLAAARAWQLCNTMLTDSAKKVGASTDDMPKQPPKHYGSPNSDMNMSTHASVFDIETAQANIHAKNHSFSQPQLVHPMTTSQMQGYANFTAFDQPMQYDPYFQPFTTDPGDMRIPQVPAQSQEAMRFPTTMPEDLDMNFMSNYLDQNPDPNDTTGGNTRGTGMSSFGQ